MKIVNGVYTSAKIFTDTIEDYTLAQIRMPCGALRSEGGNGLLFTQYFAHTAKYVRK